MANDQQTRTFTVLLDPASDRGGFTVTVPAIPAIVTEGDEAHALAMAREAISLYLRHAAEKGRPRPVERAAPRLGTVAVGADGPDRRLHERGQPRRVLVTS